MAHGGYGNRRVAGRKPSSSSNRSKGPAGGVNKKTNKKPKTVSLKNQMRSIERTLRKDLPPDVRETQEKKLEGLKKQQEIHNRLAVERKIFLRDRKIKFFERRKIERRIRRLEKMQRSSSGQPQEAKLIEQLSKLKEDLEYVRFFPKTEKYVSLFSVSEDADIVDSRNKLRKQIKANLVAAAASGKDLEETGSEDDGLLDLTDDDFFAGSSSDEGDADDELTDKSAREQASSTSGKATSGMSGDEKNQKQISARALMPPPRPSASGSFTSSRNNNSSRFPPSSSSSSSRNKPLGRSNLSSHGRSFSSSSERGFSNSHTGHSSNVSSSSEARKPRRKRRPKKKKQQF
ncbi:hypothetical protein V2J09_018040 [Rumex salicifolius]